MRASADRCAALRVRCASAALATKKSAVARARCLRAPQGRGRRTAAERGAAMPRQRAFTRESRAVSGLITQPRPSAPKTKGALHLSLADVSQPRARRSGRAPWGAAPSVAARCASRRCWPTWGSACERSALRRRRAACARRCSPPARARATSRCARLGRGLRRARTRLRAAQAGRLVSRRALVAQRTRLWRRCRAAKSRGWGPPSRRRGCRSTGRNTGAPSGFRTSLGPSFAHAMRVASQPRGAQRRVARRRCALRPRRCLLSYAGTTPSACFSLSVRPMCRVAFS
jgi:hypothetical protein